MSLLSNKRREDVEKTIRSCLIANKGGITIQQLDKDYYSIEEEHIPFREFGCNSLISFLEQLRNVLWIEVKQGFLYVHAIDSEKSRHVSSLVKGQKAPKKLSSRKSFRPSYGFAGGRPQVSINSKLLLNLVREVNLYQDGVNIDWAIQYMNKVCWPVEITRNELERQLRNISHEVKICGNSLYSMRRPREIPHHSINSYEIPQRFSNTANKSSSSASSSRPIHRAEEMSESTHSTKSDLPVRFTGEDDAIGVEDVVEKFPSKFKPTTESRRNFYGDQETSRQNSQRSQESHRETSNHLRDTKNMEKSTRDDQNYEEPKRVPDISYDENYENDKDLMDDDFEDEDYGDRSILINDRIQARLSILIQNNPDGIWCADLPQKYLDEFRISLNYTELGFDSVREFASQLPKIFHCVRPTNAGDYKLYNAKLPPPDLRSKEPQMRETLASKYRIYDDTQEDPEAFPVRLDPNTCKKLIPEGAMELGETVGHISVTELGKEHDYEEVIVSEVFTPSFFWIQLRKKLSKFKKFMNELHSYYENKESQFQIPLFMLEKGLNVACLYCKKWHRGIIRTVLPDGRSIVHFYDYGTVKSYAPDELYFLHRQFSYLSAQAIPCGLFNVRPYKTDKWSKSITWEFISRTSCPLIATIGARNEEENSMLVTLTDTRGDEDFHVNDWMYHKNYADQGRMVCKSSRNFAFSYYRKCLERKGYDPNAIHEFYVEYNDSDLSARNDPFFPVSRENLSANEKEKNSLKQTENVPERHPDPRENPKQNDSQTRSRNAHKHSTHRDYKFLKSDRHAETNPEESSSKISALSRENIIRKRSTRRVVPEVEVKPVKSKIVEIKTVVPEITEKPVESKPVESKPVSGRLLLLKRTQALLAKYQTEKGKNLETPSSPEKETSSSSGYVKTSESPKSSSPSNSISSVESVSKIEMLMSFMNKSRNSKSADSPVPVKKLADPKVILESSEPPPEKHNLVSKNQIESRPTEKRNIESNKQVENLNLDSKNQVKNPPKSEDLPVPTMVSPHTTDSLDSDSSPIHPPLLLNNKPEQEKKEITFFGNLTSECGGNGRMEPVDWSAIRTALGESEGQSSTSKYRRNSRSGNFKSRLSNKDVPLANSSTLFVVDNDPNSAQYERDVKWLPAGNVKHSRTSISPLLKLKQRLLANSYKKSAVLISSKMVSILKGELLSVSEEDETAFSIVSDTSHLEKFCEVNNVSEVQKVVEVQEVDETEKVNEVQKVDEAEKLDEVQKVDEVQNVDEDKQTEDSEKAAYLERVGSKVRMYLEAHKLRAYQDPYSSFSSTTEDEGKPKFKTADLSSLIKGFVVKNIEYREEMAKLAAELPDEPEVKSKTKKKKKKSKKNKSKARRSSSASPNSLNSSTEGTDDLAEINNSKTLEKDELPKLDDTEQKSLEKEDPKLSTLDEVSSILTNECAEGNKLDSTILTNGFVEEEDPSTNLLDEKDQLPDLIDEDEERENSIKLVNISLEDDVPDLIDVEEEEELMKLVDVSVELNKDLEEEKASILNSVECLPMKKTNSIILERLKKMQSLASSCESLDSDDLSSSDDEEEHAGNQINEWKTTLIPVVNCESSKQDHDQISQTKIASEAAPLVNSSKISQKKESKEKIDGNNLIYEEILLNPDSTENEANKEDNKFSSHLEEEKNSNNISLNSPSSSVPNKITLVFNDLDLTNDDEEWDCNSYLSDESYYGCPVFKETKNFVNQYKQLQIEEIRKEEVHSTEVPKTNGDLSSKKDQKILTSKDNRITNTKNSTTDKPSFNGIVPPNLKYPDEMKLPTSTKGSISSRISSPDRVQNSVNGKKQEFVNFQYTQEMKLTKGYNSETENSCTESEENLKTHSASLNDDDFMLRSAENSSFAIKKYEPPGKAKSLKNMLLQMQQK